MISCIAAIFISELLEVKYLIQDTNEIANDLSLQKKRLKRNLISVSSLFLTSYCPNHGSPGIF